MTSPALDAAAPAFDAAAVDALTAAALRARGSQKWTTYPGTIGAWVAEMDFPLAAPVREALVASATTPLLGYLPRAVVDDALDATLEWYRAATGWEVDRASSWLVPDVLTGLRVTLDSVTGPGTTAVVTTPAYMPFLTRPGLLGHHLATVGARQDDDGAWRHDLAALDVTLAEAASRGPVLLVLCNPWNPVGRVLTRTELLEISEVVQRHGATVFSDEIHAPLLFDSREHVPYASVSPQAAAHTITAISASKAWNLPGLKCSQLIATDPRLQEILRRPETLAGYEAATIGAVANAAAYRDGGPWLAGALAYLDGNRAAFAEALAEAVPAAKHTPPEGTYLALVDLREVRTASGAALPEDLGAFFREAGVALTDGAACGAPGFVRFNLALPRPLLREAVAALAAAIQAHP